MHPCIEEIARCHSLGNVQTHAFRRWQRILRDEVAPELDRLAAENALLHEENARLAGEVEKLTKRKGVAA